MHCYSSISERCWTQTDLTLLLGSPGGRGRTYSWPVTCVSIFSKTAHHPRGGNIYMCKCIFLYAQCLMGGSAENHSKPTQTATPLERGWFRNKRPVNSDKQTTEDEQPIRECLWEIWFLNSWLRTLGQAADSSPLGQDNVCFPYSRSELIILMVQNGLFPSGQSPSGHLQG